MLYIYLIHGLYPKFRRDERIARSPHVTYHMHGHRSGRFIARNYWSTNRNQDLDLDSPPIVPFSFEPSQFHATPHRICSNLPPSTY